MTASCKRCYTVVDLANAPFRESIQTGAGITVAFTQRDWTCPRCGGLLVREIDGTRVESGGPDPRKKVAKPVVMPIVTEASKAAKAAVASVGRRAKSK